MNRSLSTSITILAIATAIAGCAAPPSAELPDATRDVVVPSDGEMIFVDGPQFESVEALTVASSVIVSGRFGGLVGPVTEGKLNDSNSRGLPMELWTFVIEDVIAGTGIERGSEIQVSQVSMNVDGAMRPAVDGASAVLFLNPYPSGAYSIVGLGAGAVYVDAKGELFANPDALEVFAKSVDVLSFDAMADKIDASFK